ncbi:MAG: class II fumarate hydratase [Clostridia bacterium]|nr:class II fumarate hydratase [Clostridia bacterium]
MVDKFRIEHDSLGDIKVNESNLWGAQTQRSLENFNIGNEIMPLEIIKSICFIKSACAKANYQTKKLSKEKYEAIEKSVKYILENKLDQFPLHVWQTGSGTQTNMNVNEVISNVAKLNYNVIIHPNDDVNMSQSTNDVFPTSIHVALVLKIENELIPVCKELISTFEELENKYGNIIKVGRTHLQDAVPVKFGQEISGWKYSIIKPLELINNSLNYLKELPIGATAVGTGLNTPIDFDKLTIENLSKSLKKEFKKCDNKFAQLQNKDAINIIHSSLKVLAMNLMKIANDIRFLASGPKCGYGEIIIPANEPGSSIMPGKVNPTQCEQICMIATQILGNDTTISFASSQGNFELNVYMPVIAYNAIQTVNLLTDGIESFNTKCVIGIAPNEAKMRDNLEKSLMNVTALSPVIGYENAANVAKLALKDNITLKDACIKLKLLTSEEFDKIIQYKNLV